MAMKKQPAARTEGERDKAGSKEFDSEDVFSGLSAETIKALREFALKSGVAIVDHADDQEEDEDPTKNLITSVAKHFQVQDREEVFNVSYKSADGARHVEFKAKGVKRELGQTLQSTGLTIWRAAEHLCQYSIDHPELFQGKSVCELGAGLGMVSILLDKMSVCASLMVTDGDEDTMALLIENQISNDCTFDTSYLLWGEHEDFASDHRFDVCIAADVIYEQCQIEPLLDAVCAIMKEDGIFILAYARRNVPVDLVLDQAEARGLEFEVLSTLVYETEPIYAFRRKL